MLIKGTFTNSVVCLYQSHPRLSVNALALGRVETLFYLISRDLQWFPHCVKGQSWLTRLECSLGPIQFYSHRHSEIITLDRNFHICRFAFHTWLKHTYLYYKQMHAINEWTILAITKLGDKFQKWLKKPL